MPTPIATPHLRIARRLLLLAACTAVAVLILLAWPTADAQEAAAPRGDLTAEAAVAVRKLDDGRVQLCLNLRLPDADRADRQCPPNSVFPWPRADVGVWYRSRPIAVAETDVWVRARRTERGQIEFLVQADPGLDLRTYTPRLRFLNYDSAAVDRWAVSSPVTVDLTLPPFLAPTPLAVQLDRSAPDFQLPDLLDRSQILRLSDFRGQTVVIVFWASWSPDDRDTLALLDDLARADPSLAVLGINVYDDLAAARALLQKNPTSFSHVFDRELAVASLWRVDGLPDLFIIDSDGVYRAAVRGPAPGDRIAAAIDHVRNVRSGAAIP